MAVKELYIIGAGGFAREVFWLVRRINAITPVWDFRGFIDDNPTLKGKQVDGMPVLGDIASLNGIDHDFYCVAAIGSAQGKRRALSKLTTEHALFPNLIDPAAIVSDRVQLGHGDIICAGSILTVDITLGGHVIINLSCTLGHDDVVEDYVTINPGTCVSGNVTIEEAVEVGTGTHIIQGKHIAADTVIGAGTVVIKDIETAGTYVGDPARKVR